MSGNLKISGIIIGIVAAIVGAWWAANSSLDAKAKEQKEHIIEVMNLRFDASDELVNQRFDSNDRRSMRMERMVEQIWEHLTGR